MVTAVQIMPSPAVFSVAHVTPVAAMAAAVAPPSIASVLDAADSSGQYGLYKLNDGSIAKAGAGLAMGASLPADGIVLKVGEKLWSQGKAGTLALISTPDGFSVIMKSGEGSRAKFSRQEFDAAGLATAKPAALAFGAALEAELSSGQDLNGDSALGDVVASTLDTADNANQIGLYVLTSGKVVIDSDALAIGTGTSAQTVTLTQSGKNWKPGKMQALAVRQTADGYEVLLKSGMGAKAKYLYHAFDTTGVARASAQATTTDVLLDRELLYGQDLNGDGQRGNIVKTVIDPTAPIVRNDPAESSPYARSTKVNSEVFLGGRYIELGVSAWGNFGTEGAKPGGFTGAPTINGIGMSADHDGYGAGINLPIDYFLPGTPEERFAVGFQSGGMTTTNSNSARMNTKNMSTVVSNDSKGRKLAATAVSTWSVNGSAVMTVKQEISFDAESLWFKNRVTLTNETGTNWTSARYLRSFDPDNTAAQGGAFSTANTVIGTVAADGYAAVKAETSASNDPLYQAFNARSPIMFFSMDSRAVASTFGFSNSNPYAAQAYGSPAARNSTVVADQAITLSWDAGALTAGQSASFDYYTSLDNRVADAIISEIYGVGLYQLQSGSYAVGRAPTSSGDLPKDRVILKDKGKPWSPKGASPIAVKADSEGYQVTYKTGTGTKTKYILQKFDTDGVAIGKAEVLSTAKLVVLEPDFQHDLNRDTYLGNKITETIDTTDPTNHKGLYKVAAGGVWLSANNLSPGGDLTPGAVQLVTKGKTWVPGKETPLAVRINASGLYELMTRSGIGTSAKYIEYTIDQTGDLTGKPARLKATQIVGREAAYGQDLNGNGVIGV